MRSEPTKKLIQSVQSVSSPPVIKPPEQNNIQYAKPKQPYISNEIMHVLRVQPEYREHGHQRLTLILTDKDKKFNMPKLRIHPGMRIQITLLPMDSTYAKEGHNAKK